MTPAARARMRVQAPLLAAGAAAWLALVARSAGTAAGPMHAMHPSAPWAPGPLAGEAALMFAAMMLPLSAAPVVHVRDRSFARRRWRAASLFLAGYTLPWIAAGAGLLMVAARVGAARSAAALALAAVVAAVWQCSPHKQRCLNRTHAHPALAAFGARADWDVLRFGFSHAFWCIGSCSALMLLPMLFTRGHLAMMVGVMLWLAGERMEKPMAPRWRLRAPGNAVRLAVGQARVWAAVVCAQIPAQGGSGTTRAM